MATFALVDCNNFYASCERLFQPDLQERPVVVLSNADSDDPAQGYRHDHAHRSDLIPRGIPI